MEGGESDSQDNSLNSRARVVLLDTQTTQLNPHSSELHSLTQQTSYHPSSARNNQSSTLFASAAQKWTTWVAAAPHQMTVTISHPWLRIAQPIATSMGTSKIRTGKNSSGRRIRRGRGGGMLAS
jgi:hypothetical protein